MGIPKYSGPVVAQKVKVTNEMGEFMIDNVASVEISDLARQTVEIKGAGIGGVINMPIADFYEDITLTFTINGSPQKVQASMEAILFNELAFVYAHNDFKSDYTTSLGGIKVFATITSVSNQLGTITVGETPQGGFVATASKLRIVDAENNELWYIDKFNPENNKVAGRNPNQEANNFIGGI